MSTHCSFIVQAPKSGQGQLPIPTPSVHPGVADASAQISRFEMCICIYASFSFQQSSPDRGRPISQVGCGTLDGIHIGAGFAHDAPSCIVIHCSVFTTRTPERIPGEDVARLLQVKVFFSSTSGGSSASGQYDDRRSSMYQPSIKLDGNCQPCWSDEAGPLYSFSGDSVSMNLRKNGYPIQSMSGWVEDTAGVLF
ncbi:hypothetical protein BC826DRAFT_983687 [Russula brevipes]|nr:hypothetical protein BC826DRAFT_983687 [Russula brevipes]